MGLWKHVGLEIANKTFSTSFEDIDISSIVGSQRVVCMVTIRQLDLVSYVMYFRPKGETYDPAVGYVGAHPLNYIQTRINRYDRTILVTDSNGVFEARANGNVTEQLVLEGYFVPSEGPAMVNAGLSMGTTPVDVDMSSVFGSSKAGLAIMRNRRVSSTGGYSASWMPKGNTKDPTGGWGGIPGGAQRGTMRVLSTTEIEGTLSITDGDGVLQAQSDADLSISHEAYMWAGETYNWVHKNTLIWDNEVKARNTWYDIDTGSGGRGMAVFAVTFSGGSGVRDFYLRRKGDTRVWNYGSSGYSTCGAHIYGFGDSSRVGVVAVDMDENGFVQFYPYAQYSGQTINYTVTLLGYVAGETLPKSGTGTHSHWGSFAATSDLPNVSGASTQDSSVEAGDRAYVTSTSKSYQCTVATLGSATWIDMEDDTEAIHDDENGEINALSQKLYPTDSDIMLIEDVADSNNKKSITCGDLPTGAATDPTAIHDNVAAEISAITQKTTTVLDDEIVIEDSEDSNSKKSMKWGSYPRKGSQSNLWYPPASPHSENDEFDSDTLDASWYAWNNSTGAYESLVTGLDTYDGSYSGDDIRYSLNPDERRSWLLMQGADAVTLNIGKTITFPTNLLIMARLKFNQYYSTQIINDRFVAIRIQADSSGEPDANNHVTVALNNPWAGAVFGRMVTKDGAVTGVDNYTTDVDSQGQALEYAAIHKIGTTYHGWLGTAGGNWIYMGNDTISATMVHVAVSFRIDTNNLPGLGVVGVDFIRFLETDNFLL